MITRFIKRVAQAWAYAICAVLFSCIVSGILTVVFYIACYTIANKSIPALVALLIAVPAAVWLIPACCFLFFPVLDYLDPTYRQPDDNGE
jgi:ABC-type dipeptide/oligopeptide/nickel transport system permease component